MKKLFHQIVSVVICCFMTVGLLGCGTNPTEAERKYLELPGAGVYMDETDEPVYAVEIEPAVMEKDGVKVELKDFYAKNQRFYGEVFLSGDLLFYPSEEERNEYDRSGVLEEKYKVTWYFGEESRKMISTSQGANVKNFEDGTSLCNEYHVDCEEYLYLEDKGIDTYYLQVNGFDEKFTLKVTEPKRIASMEELGYAQTQNGNMIATRASVEEDGIGLEYYCDLTEESAPLYQREDLFAYTVIPNHYEKGISRRIFNKNGKELRILKVEQKMNGNYLLLEGTEADFPLEFYFSGFSGTSGEEYTISLPIPEMGEKLTENLPKTEFEYGIVEILSVERNGGLVFTYDVTAKEGSRQMYGVQMKKASENEELHLGGGGNWKADGEVMRGEVNVQIDNAEEDTVDVILYHPSHWIEGEYNITIEKPTEE